jgi:hypothetical protein
MHHRATPDDVTTRVAVRAAAFSLVRGDWLDRIQRRLGIVRPGRRRALRRAALVGAFTWVPLLLLSAAQRVGYLAPSASIAFDLATHVRNFVAIPLLLLAEDVVDERFALVVRTFVDEALVPDHQLPDFERALARSERLRDDWEAPVLMIGLAFVWSWFVARARLHQPNPTWFAPAGHLSWAAWWQVLVSTPIFAMLVMLWVWRWVLWSMFLLRMARLDLQIVGTHPDGAGSLGFLALPSYAFALVVFACTAAISAAWGQLALFQGARVLDFVVPGCALVATSLAVGLGPLMAFSPRLLRVKLRDVEALRVFTHRVMRWFDEGWVQRRDRLAARDMNDIPAEVFANMGDSYARTAAMRTVPFDKMTVLVLAAAVVVPMLPLTLTQLSLRDLARTLLKALM